MLRRGELALVAASIGALALAVALGLRAAPDDDFEDQRLSTYSTGRNGAKGLAQVLGRLGVSVRPRRYALFDLADDTTRADPRRLFAFLDISLPTPPEIAAVGGYVARGGRIFVGGYTGIERCFGYHSASVAGPRFRPDSIALDLSQPGWRAPQATRVLSPAAPESLQVEPEWEDEEGTPPCAPLHATVLDTLLRASDGRPVALRLGFPQRGEAILLADARYLRNQTLKETDAGLMVLPWFLDGRTHTVIVDEYHHGHPDKSSLLFAAAWRWLTTNPVGWAMLQLLGVGLVALAVAAVRFGPPQRAIETRRRSPLEHLEALAAGLEGAGGVDTAVALTVSGLARRLGRAGVLRPDQQGAWLAGLELVLPTAAGRDAVRRLQQTLSQPGGPERALAAAQAAEDVWVELRPPTRRAAS